MTTSQHRPRLLAGLLGLSAADREQLSHLVIIPGDPRTVSCHFHDERLPVVTGEIAAEPEISEQVAELRRSEVLGSGVDTQRRDGVTHVRLWAGPYERAAWDARMAAVVEHPDAVAVLAAAGEVKAAQVRSRWAQAHLERVAAAVGDALGAQTAASLSQQSSTSPPAAMPAPDVELVRMPMGHDAPCAVCGGKAHHTLGSIALHPAECRRQYLEQQAARAVAEAPGQPHEQDAVVVDVVSSDLEQSPAPVDTDGTEPVQPAATREESSAPQEDPAAPSQQAPRRPSARPPSSLSGPAVVLDVDVVGLPDGSEVEHPFEIDSLAAVARLVEHYHLGVEVTKVHTEAGQVWITAAMLARLGVSVPKVKDPRKLIETFREATRGIPLVVDAVQAGWDIGGSSGEGPSLGRWTWMRRGPHQALVAMIPLMVDLSAQPLLEGDPAAGHLARRLALFAETYRHPFKMSAQTTGFDYVRTLRWKERVAITEPQVDHVFQQAELDGNWTRRPTEPEMKLPYLHGYDRGGSYAAGLSSGGHFGVGQPVHIEGPVELERTTYGLVRIAELPDGGDWRAPHPLVADVGFPPREGGFWRHTTTLRWAQERGYEPEILEAWIWPRTMPIFATWYTRLRDARTRLLDLEAAGDPDARPAIEQLKAVYTRMIGQMAPSDVDRKGEAWYAPDRRWGIIAQSRVNIERLIWSIGTATEASGARGGMGIWPVAMDNDTIVYASDDPDPVTAWPGDPSRLGTGIGQMKWEGSTMMADHLDHLSGQQWFGKDELTKDWNPGGERT